MFLKQDRHEENPIAVVVEENGHLISVVSLDSALAPPVGGSRAPDREGFLPVRGRGASTVVVTVTARTWVFCPK